MHETSQDYIGDSIQNINHLSAYQTPLYLNLACPQARLKRKQTQQLNFPTVILEEP